MSSYQIKYNEALVEKSPLKHGKVGADHIDIKIHDPSLKERNFTGASGSKTATGQHAAEGVQKAKATALPSVGRSMHGLFSKPAKQKAMLDAAGYLAHESSQKSSGFMDYVDGVNSARDSTVGMFKHMASHPLDTLTAPVFGAWNVASHPILSYQNAVHSTTDFMESFANASGAERLGMTLSVAGNGIYGSAFGAGARIGLGKAYSSYGKTWQSPIHFDISGMGSTLNSGIDLSRLKFRSILPKHVPGTNYAHNRLQLEALKTEYRQQASWVNPSEIKHSRLRRKVEEFYRKNAKVGSGSTADAARVELSTPGIKIGGSESHAIKVGNEIKFLESMIKSGELNAHERMISENIRLDMLDAVGDKLWYSQTTIPKF